MGLFKLKEEKIKEGNLDLYTTASLEMIRETERVYRNHVELFGGTERTGSGTYKARLFGGLFAVFPLGVRYPDDSLPGEIVATHVPRLMRPPDVTEEEATQIYQDTVTPLIPAVRTALAEPGTEEATEAIGSPLGRT